MNGLELSEVELRGDVNFGDGRTPRRSARVNLKTGGVRRIAFNVGFVEVHTESRRVPILIPLANVLCMIPVEAGAAGRQAGGAAVNSHATDTDEDSDDNSEEDGDEFDGEGVDEVEASVPVGKRGPGRPRKSPPL